VVVDPAAKDAVWRGVEWMLRVIAKRGRFLDEQKTPLKVTVYLGLFSSAGDLLLTENRTWQAGTEFGDGIAFEVQANIYKAKVLGAMVDKEDYGHYLWDNGQEAGEFEKGTEVYDLAGKRVGVVSDWVERGGKGKQYYVA
jgi:hypothetical protein